MIDIPRRYQISFFGSFSDLRPSADTIPPLLDAFRDRGFLPQTFHEIGPSAPAPQPRLRLGAPDNEWVIDLETRRISVDKNPTKSSGANMGSINDFVDDATAFLQRILKRHPTKASRLSLVTRGLWHEIADDRLSQLYARVFVPLPYYVEHAPVEWHSRSVARLTLTLGDREELVNVIVQISRIQGQMTATDAVAPFDRLEIVFDINTYQGNIDPRFDLSSASRFFAQALAIRERVLSELEETLDAR